MKLKHDFVSQNIDETSYLVPVGGISFQGIVRGNRTTGIILNCLEKGSTEEEIVDVLCAGVDVPREEVVADVEEILSRLREIGALED